MQNKSSVEEGMARVSQMLDMLLEVGFCICLCVCLFVLFVCLFVCLFVLFNSLHQSGYDPLLRPGQDGESTQVSL